MTIQEWDQKHGDTHVATFVQRVTVSCYVEIGKWVAVGLVVSVWYSRKIR